MAGDWIKMRVDLRDDPDVIGIAAATGLDEDTVVGKLHRIWSWADQQTANGNAHSVTRKWLDRYIGVTGFAEAMEKVGWLTVMDDGIQIPDFDTHNGQSGKRRALTAKRVAKKRSAKCNAPSVTSALPEKRREEKNKEDKNTTCSSTDVALPPSAVPNGGDASSFVFPIISGEHKPKTWTLPAAKLAEYRQTFTGLNVDAELAKAVQWCRDNPKKRKTAAGMMRFCFGWLERNQNRGSPPIRNMADGGEVLDTSFKLKV